MTKTSSLLLLCTVVSLSGCTTVAGEPRLDGLHCVRISKVKSCTTTPVPSTELEADAKRFKSSPDRTTLWLVRSSPTGGYRKIAVSIQGRQIWLLENTSARITLPSGTAEIATQFGSSPTNTLLLHGKPGEQIFVDIAAIPGVFQESTSLRRISEHEGREKVLASKLVSETNVTTSLPNS